MSVVKIKLQLFKAEIKYKSILTNVTKLGVRIILTRGKK